MDSPQVSPNSAVLHRRPAYAVNAPALLCHQCYRFRDVAESGSSELSKIRRNIATIELNTVLYRIQTTQMAIGSVAPIYVVSLRALQSDQRTPEELAEAAKQESAKKVFDDLSRERFRQLCEVDSQVTILANLSVVDDAADIWTHWRARLRVDLHSEFYSVTYILDAKRQGVCPPHTDPAKPDLPEDHSGASQQKRYFHKWYEDIWTEFFKLLDLPANHYFSASDKFFECRGLAIPSSFAPIKDPAAHDDIITHPLKKEEADEAKKKILNWPNARDEFIRLVLQLDRTGAADKDANCILCLVLDGRALFASAMGQPGGEKRVTEMTQTADTAQFESYLLVHDRLPRFQLGRLLRRFHVLDELRCSAIFDFPELIEASERLRTLGNTIDQRLAEAQAHSKKPCLSSDALSDIQNKLNNLTSGLSLPDQHKHRNEGRKAAGGLLYRINRSRYYANDFKLRMTDMLIERIEGWEPYDLFMHRNMFPIIDHIDSIGKRFDALAARVERLTEASDVDEQIKVQTGLMKVQSKIADIQEIGEIIGWTAFAYYGGQILDKLFSKAPSSCSVCDAIDPCIIAHAHAGTVISIGIAIWGFIHFRNLRRKHDEELKET